MIRLANAPAKLRRAYAATQSATGLPRAASFSRLLASMLTATEVAVQPTEVEPIGLT
jgi:hypothetical protein